MKMPILIAVLVVALSQNLFAAGKQLTGQHAPATTPALAPAEAVKAFKVPPGFEVRLFAAEPDIVNPVAMTWDDRGRLWVLELYEYPLGVEEGKKGRDRIRICEDTDNDGRADKFTTFADGFVLATGLLWGNGGVYLGQAPDLLFLQDTNGDDICDKREVVLTGFGLHDRHELLNGFTWGPDGQLYMTHGVFTASKVKIPEATTPGIHMDAAVARVDVRTRKFEIYADGTSNPWGVDFDKYGNAFVSACVIDHLFHMAPGGIYQRQGGVPGNPYAYELLPSIVDHKHHMAAYCGVCVYQGDLFPAEYQGRVFMGNIHQNAINHDKLTPNGSSFKATAEPDFLTTSDGWFMPISEQVGPDGALWIGDWYDKYPCYQNAQADPEGVDRTHGRIWRVVYTGDKPGKKLGSRPDKKMDLGKMKSAQLVKLLEHPNVWQRKAAQRLLGERLRGNDPFRDVANQQLVGMLSGKPASNRWTNSFEAKLAALWTIHSSGITNVHIGGGGDAIQVMEPAQYYSELMKANEPAIRAWAARFLVERFNATQPEKMGDPRNLIRLETLASDPDPSVRLAVATAVRQLVSSSLTINTPPLVENVKVGSILAALIKSSADAKDPLLPFMIWMASEPQLAKNPKNGLKWLAENGADTLPLSGILARKAMRRICDTGEAEKMDAAVEFLSAVASNNKLSLAALEGLIEGQRAKPLRPTIDTKEMFSKLTASSSAAVKEQTQKLGAIWGDSSALEITIETIRNAANNENRIKAIQSVKQLKATAARDVLLELIAKESNEQVIVEAIQALGAIGGDNVASAIVKHWKKLTPNARRAAADMMISRPPWTRQLLDSLDDKVILPSELSATVVRALFNSKNPNFVGRTERLFGKFRETDADKLQIISAKRKAVLQGEPNMKRGHELAQKACFVCHKLHGEGAEVGPDLTGVGRSTLDALLANVIDPNQIIGKGYENVIVELKDERTISGRLIENSDSHVKLLAAGPKEEVIAKSDMASMKVSELSVMPEGLEQMPDDEFRDLIWYILAPPQEGSLTPEKKKALSGQ